MLNRDEHLKLDLYKLSVEFVPTFVRAFFEFLTEWLDETIHPDSDIRYEVLAEVQSRLEIDSAQSCYLGVTTWTDTRGLWCAVDCVTNDKESLTSYAEDAIKHDCKAYLIDYLGTVSELNAKRRVIVEQVRLDPIM